jgi:hypothetical protein
MKKILSLLILLACVSMNSEATKTKKSNNIIKAHAVGGNIKIKIKNDTDDIVTVYSGSGNSSYRLLKNIVTTIVMEEGAKLFDYNGGKKGRVLLEVSADMDGKLQLYSKL